MMLFKMAFRNVLRNKRRSLLTAVGIIIAVMLIVFAQGFVTGMVDNMIENTSRVKSGHIRIVTPEYLRREKLSPLEEALYITPELEEVIEQTPEMTAYTYRIPFGVLLSKGENSKPAFGNAIDVEREKGFIDFSSEDYLVEGSYLKPGDEAILLGAGLAEELEFSIGDSLVIITSTAYGSPSGMNLTVKGIVQTGHAGVDDNAFYIPLAAAQQLLDLDGRAAEALVLLESRDDAEDVASRWQRELGEKSGLKIIPWQQDELLGMMQVVFRVYWVIYFIILLIASATIINTMLMAVFERIKEIGIMKAMGMRGNRILWLLTAEASMIGLLGAAIGAVLGVLLVLLVGEINFSALSGQNLGSIYFDPVIKLNLTAGAAIGCFLFGWLVATLTALYPARQGTKVRPAEALRRV
ncbi:FtsX-like permease family protein [candidate division WOR-3 bacterium]|uniref:FtsX-like permease family protein n=1 Tax=candidate division WOR-3 bacterium TaxID=2052148 RepID=A0A9D5QER5_UNCW3|nr:FtsX-like permease family protein [candidate division WOR-3 bacterium]MBD3365280.1 FtsX-like permease family protein [candidate division WOR-3 bacterium]